MCRSLWAFMLQEFVQVPRVLWLYSCTKLSHVVYAHRLHTSLLCHIRPRIPLGVCLPIPLSRWLGYPCSPRSPVTCPSWGPHHPLQRLSQETSVVDVTHKEMRFLVTDLGGEDIILGYPWLAMFEPPITWGTATIDVSSVTSTTDVSWLRCWRGWWDPRDELIVGDLGERG